MSVGRRSKEDALTSASGIILSTEDLNNELLKMFIRFSQEKNRNKLLADNRTNIWQKDSAHSA